VEARSTNKITAHGAVGAMLLAALANERSNAQSPAVADNENSDAIAEIVVTAERRSETLQRTSLAVSVLDGDALARAGVEQARDLSSLVPGLQITTSGVTLRTYIRGVGDFSSSSLGVPADGPAERHAC
jgi:iron complex outermembrane receptor protein